MKTPMSCESLEDVRAEIDRIDEQIIALLGRRLEYVRVAAKFKRSEAEVAAPDRQKAMLEARREWAQREGLDPGLIEQLYRDLVAWFISHEMQHFQDGKPD